MNEEKAAALTAHVAAEVSDALRKVAVDLCRHCGDIVIAHNGQQWAHYRGVGSLLNRCQHTVPYGYDAEPRNGGFYFPVVATLLADASESA